METVLDSPTLHNTSLLGANQTRQDGLLGSLPKSLSQCLTWLKGENCKSNPHFARSAGAVEYTDCFSADG